MALSPQQELQIREELETNPTPQRELALRESLEGAVQRPKKRERSFLERVGRHPITRTIIEEAKKRLPTSLGRQALSRSDRELGAFARGIPQGIQEGGVGLLQTAADLAPQLPIGARVLAGGAGLAREEDIQRANEIITRFQDQSNRAFEAREPRTGAAFGRGVGRALPLILGAKGLGSIPALSAPGVAGLATRVGTGSGLGFAGAGTEFIGAEDPNQDRLARAEFGAKVGGAIPVVAAAARFAKEPIKSALRGTIGRGIKKRLETEFGKQGLKISKAVAGGKLPFGPITGSKSVKSFESQALSSPAQFEKAIPGLNAVNKDIIKSTLRGLKHVKTGAVTPTTVGKALKKNFDNSLVILKGHRRLAANRDFGVIDKLSNKQTQFVSTSNTRKEFDRVAKQIELAGEKGKFMVTIAKKLRKKGGVSLQELLQMRSRMSSASSGGRSLWKDLSDTETKRFAAKAMAAIDKDILFLSKNKGGGLGKAIRTALTNYKNNSATLNNIEGTAFGQILGGKQTVTPDVIAKKVLGLSPDQLREGMGIVASRGGRRAVAIVQKQYIKNIIDKSTGGGTDVGTQLPFNPRMAGELFKADKKRFFALFPKPALRKQVIDSFDAFRRMGTLPKGGGSLTPAQLQVEVARNVISKNAIFSVGTLAKALPPGILRKALFTEAGRKSLITIARPLTPKGQILTTAALVRWKAESEKAKNTILKLKEK